MPGPKSGLVNTAVLIETHGKIKEIGLLIEKRGGMPKAFDYWVVKLAVDSLYSQLKARKKRKAKPQ